MSAAAEPVAGAAPLIELERVYKVYRRGTTGVAALGGVSFDVGYEEFVAVVGPSGAGKSSILNIVGGLDQATAGTVRVAGVDLGQLSDQELTRYRRTGVGFVWQGTARNLVPYLTLSSNVEVPLLAAGLSRGQRRVRVGELLELVGLSDRAGHLPWMLSGGEQQRGAVAVALANLPPLILADEPTAELDSRSAERVLGVFRAARTELGTTVLMVTHDLLAAARADRVVRVIDGRVRNDAGLALVEDDGRLVLPPAALAELLSEGAEIGIEVTPGEVHLRGRTPLPRGDRPDA
jgi:putative ABC transport system ATP-binding protein